MIFPFGRHRHGRVVVGPRVVVGHGAILHSCRVGAGALVSAGSVVYPRTRVPPRTVFRNDAGGNRPSIAPLGTRLRRWDARSYRRIVAVYRRHGTVAPGAGRSGHAV